MAMKVHCPGCKKPLRVPQSSSGRKARCPMCRSVFVVPKPEDLVEETISTWIEEDLEKLSIEHEKQWEDIGSLKAYQKPAGPVKVGMRKAMPQDGRRSESGKASVPPAAARASGHDTGSGSTIIAEEELLAVTMPVAETGAMPAAARAAAPPPALAPAPAPSPAAPAPSPAAPAAPPAPVSRPTITAAPAPAAPLPAIAVAPRAAPADESARQYPTSLRADTGRPHLVVIRADQTGVQFAFDYLHLENMGFRVSLPIRCAFTGETDRRKLTARPFAFIDRSSARIRSPQEVDVKHSTSILPSQSVRDLLPSMGEIVNVPKPFNLPMPYFSGPELGHISLRCWTETRVEDTGFTCFVVIPEGQTALQWLMNVNGACGIEYEMLEYDVALMQNDGWRQLGDECRRRLTVWCHFEPAEQFRLYLSDGDFGTRDRGLAGLVFTNSRLIYCKYHHRGAVDLAQPATILVREEGDFCVLALENADGRTKLVKLHKNDMPPLAEALASHPAVQISQTAKAS